MFDKWKVVQRGKHREWQFSLSIASEGDTGFDHEHHGRNLIGIYVGPYFAYFTCPEFIKSHRYMYSFTKTWEEPDVEGNHPIGSYEKCIARKYGFSANEDALHVYYGLLSHDSGDQSACFFYPWQYEFTRERWIDIGQTEAIIAEECRPTLFSQLNQRGKETHYARTEYDFTRLGLNDRYDERVKEKLPNYFLTLPYVDPYDGEEMEVTCSIQERTWQRGRNWWFRKLLFFCPKLVRTSVDLEFSKQTGPGKGSWKGGVLGCSIDLLPGESIISAVKRYRQKEGGKYL